MPTHYTYKCTSCNRTEERYRNARKSRCCHADVVRLTAVVKTQIELDLEDCRAEIIRLRRTLEFYATPEHWLLGPGLWEWIGPDSDPMQPWSTAQAALNEVTYV